LRSPGLWIAGRGLRILIRVLGIGRVCLCGSSSSALILGLSLVLLLLLAGLPFLTNLFEFYDRDELADTSVGRLHKHEAQGLDAPMLAPERG
jgi:hypothetical protein